ncbi:hypothetical protein MTR67_028898 [Solanum verrucosum]|uniref:Small nuclear ribonucleoprotein E n=1 Tax=Solanum verrucosum TaxID=315347 RepID=A0AAF0U0Q2_SOLVR|nr:hypothetical protein MTR67_028898 [Solanum verrucosum]
MASTKVQRIMTQPINLIFRFLQSKARIQIWLFEQKDQRIEGRIIGFDEYMNLVLDDAEEVNVKKNSRKQLGRILLKGDNITLMMNTQLLGTTLFFSVINNLKYGPVLPAEMEAKLKVEKTGAASKHSRKGSFSRPSWLLCTIAGPPSKRDVSHHSVVLQKENNVCFLSRINSTFNPSARLADLTMGS